MIRMTIGLALGCALAACSGDAGEGGSVTPEQAAERARDFVKPEPGLYRTTVEITDFDMPNVPDQVKAMMKQNMSSTTGHEYCLTPQDVEKGYEDAIRKGQQGDCAYKKFDLANGTIDALMSCKQDGRTTEIALTGTATSTSSDTQMTMTMDVPGVGPGTIRAKSRSARIGDCPA